MGEGKTVNRELFLTGTSKLSHLASLFIFNDNFKASFSLPEFGGGQRCQLCSSSVRYVLISMCAGIRRMPAGQQGWARCGAGTVGRLGTVGLLIREV